MRSWNHLKQRHKRCNLMAYMDTVEEFEDPNEVEVVVIKTVTNLFSGANTFKEKRVYRGAHVKTGLRYSF